jgi:methyl-accepting chemotaxis protein
MDTMRRSVTSTSRAMGEQASAGAQISGEAERLMQFSATVSKAMGEQSTAATQMNAAVGQMRQQADQIARAMREQARAIKDMTEAAQNVAKQIGLITDANREHSASSAAILDTLTSVHQVAERNAQGVRETQRTAESLLARAQSLVALIEPGAGQAGNGRL